MKIRTYLFLFCAVCGLNAVAARKEKKQKTQAPAVKVDTVSVDTFSYAMGMLQTEGLKAYLTKQKGIEERFMDDFLRGLQASQMTEEDLREQARIEGMMIRSQIEKDILPKISSSLNDTLLQVNLNKDMFMDGFVSAFRGQAGIARDTAKVMADRQISYYQRVRAEKKYGDNLREGVAFLEKNARERGVKVTPSGLQYRIITFGKGEVPQDTSKVKVHYEGRLIDGTVFDSSYKRGEPMTFAANQVIPGWTEALTMMPVGSKWQLFIPQELAYKERETGKIKPFSCLIFTVELIDIVK